LHRSLTWLAVIAIVLVSVIVVQPAAARDGGKTLQKLSLIGSGGFSASTTTGTGAPGVDEFAPDTEVDQEIPHTGTGAARVPADHVPTPAGNAVTTSNPGATGFEGISHRDQRLADGGNAFSLEPPDQALCVGNGFVLESVNLAVRAFSTAGAPLSATQSLNTFFGLTPAIVRTDPPVYGTFTSDPKCYFDKGLSRWFLTILGLDRNPSGGAYTGKTEVYIAVSKTSSPVTGGWYIYKLDTTDDGSNGTPSHTNCPCLGDQPLIGADANGFYISTNEFPLFANGFNGAQVYAMSKAALAAGTLPTVVHFDVPTLAEGYGYTIQPATTPPGGAYATGNGGTEYFLSALDFNGQLDNRIAVWAMTNTSSLSKKNPDVSLSNAVLDSQVYGQPPDAEQRPGATPLGDSVNGKLEFLAGNDDRMNQAVWAAGKLWGAVNTAVKTPNGPTRIGIAYFAVTPTVSSSGQVAGTIAQQGYVAVNRNSVMFPSIGVNVAGQAVMTFTLVGPDYYPSAAYAVIGTSGAGDVHVLGAGAGPEDGFTGYSAFGGSRTARWGDYSAAVADESGTIWTAVEYIPGSPRTVNANWGTFIGRVTP
jgi:hypothetical protein